MTKILVKGGIWKNTEDEVLKVAVMKYGKNQWSRIASLLHKKTAKQCKSRWYEWLDPGIKKTEWSREEDEKLLHLAKLMPTQWRTIAPLVGRTASQCLERYEHLLDQAQAGDGLVPEGEDPRKLRPGEVDPNPETKPARPDPIDMDEDELEMLSEARARLANTQGKKAKRKAREKQLDEARRLATIQKKRELKSAGVKFVNLQKMKRVIDFNVEIPLEKKAPHGFYDTSKETVDPYSQEFKDMRKKEYTRRDRVEILERRKDKEKFKTIQETDPIRAIMLTSNSLPTKRSKLILPQPQISQNELEEVVKLGQESESAKATLFDDSEGLPTKSLLNEYGRTPFIRPDDPQSIRTPIAVDNVMRDAKTLIALNMTETPLKGGQNVALGESGLNFLSSATPSVPQSQTPNSVLASPYKTPRTNLQSKKIQTPLHDSLSINKDDTASGFSSQASTPSFRKERNIMIKNLHQQLSSLPKPVDDFEISIPEDEEIIDPVAPPKVKDASEEEEHVRFIKAEEERIAFELLPQSVKRSLPIPTDFATVYSHKSGSQMASHLQKAEELISEELMSLLASSSGQKTATGGVSLDEINSARKMIEEECKSLYQDSINFGAEEFNKTFEEVWQDNYNDVLYVPSEKRFTKSPLAKDHEKLESSKFLFETLQKIYEKSMKASQKQQDKLKILHGGYINRRKKMVEEYDDLVDKLNQANEELSAFELLKKQEDISMPMRLEETLVHVERCKATEHVLQYQYLELVRKRDELKEIKEKA